MTGAKDDIVVRFLEPGDDISAFNIPEIDAGNNYWIGIFDGDELAGVCSIGGADCAPEYAEICEEYDPKTSGILSDVYVLPERRGLGYGSRLVSGAEKLSEYKILFLDVLEDNLFAFYERLGFKRIENSFSMHKEGGKFDFL